MVRYRRRAWLPVELVVDQVEDRLIDRLTRLINNGSSGKLRRPLVQAP